MSDDLSQNFMRALQQAEASGDVGPLVSLFAPDARLENPARSVTRQGRAEAEQFWREYLSAFGQVHSEFTNVHAGDGFATLEWSSRGTLPTGGPVNYRGVSLLEFDPPTDQGQPQVRRFCTYYDSATFLPHGSKHASA